MGFPLPSHIMRMVHRVGRMLFLLRVTAFDDKEVRTGHMPLMQSRASLRALARRPVHHDDGSPRRNVDGHRAAACFAPSPSR